MKAVNLIPTDLPKGRKAAVAGGVARPSGPIGAYVVLALLAVCVVMAGAWAVTSKQASDKRAEAARIEREALAAEAKAKALKPYTEFAALSKARVDTVGGLLAGRFDWAHSLREVARVVPGDVSLTSLVGTVAPESKTGGATSGSLRKALPVPAIDLIGCAKSQAHVATLLARLRAIDGVQRVTLLSSEKSDAGAASDADCRSTAKMPQFQLTVFYRAQDGIVPAASAAAPNPAASAATTTPNTGGAK